MHVFNPGQLDTARIKIPGCDTMRHCLQILIHWTLSAHWYEDGNQRTNSLTLRRPDRKPSKLEKLTGGHSWCTHDAVSKAEKSLGRHKMHIFRESVNNDKNDSVTLSPKSKAMSDHGQPGTGKGQSRPAVGWWEAFLWARSVQVDTKVRVSVSMVDHQKCHFRRERMRLIRVTGEPGLMGPLVDLGTDWVRNKEVFKWTSTWVWLGLLSCLNNRFNLFFFFFFNLIAATAQDKGRMVSRLEGV